MAKLRAGLIGTGTIAHSAHLPAMRYLRDEIELVAVADIREETAQAAAREYGAEAWYSDYRQLLERDDIDFVDICTPEFLHHEQVVAAVEAGKHVLCEKPMAASVAEADAMIKAAQENGVRLMIGHSRRFTDRYRHAHQAISEGRIGTVQVVRENERRPVAMYSALDLATGYWSPDGERPWLTNPEYTQGAALTNAVHEMDLARWFVGDDAESVHAESRIVGENAEVADFLTYTIAFKNGAIGAAEVVNALPPSYPYFHMLEIYGDEGYIQARDPDQSPYKVWEDAGMRYPANFPQLLHVDGAYIREIGWFAQSLRNDSEPPLVSVRVTTAALGGQNTDAWFVLARFADDTIATIEVDAVLPPSGNAAGALVIEATGSDGVLHAEPERQSVSVTSEHGTEHLAWHPGLAGTLLEYASTALERAETTEQQAIHDLLRLVPKAANTDEVTRAT